MREKNEDCRPGNLTLTFVTYIINYITAPFNKYNRKRKCPFTFPLKICSDKTNVITSELLRCTHIVVLLKLEEVNERNLQILKALLSKRFEASCLVYRIVLLAIGKERG